MIVKKPAAMEEKKLGE